MIEMEKIISKLQKDFGLTQSLLSDQKQKNATLQSNISRIETKFEEIRNENNKLRLEIESTNNYALNKEKHLNREIEQLREELDRKSLDMEKGLKDLK
jgi:chromosome segregation ATPase